MTKDDFRAVVDGDPRRHCDIAAEAGISGTYLSQILGGDRIPTPVVAIALERVTGFPAGRWRTEAVAAATLRALEQWQRAEVKATSPLAAGAAELPAAGAAS